MKHRISFFLYIFLALHLFVSCQEAEARAVTEDSLTIATWNVQNLFNAVDDGTEYEEYLGSSGWTQTYYKARLSAVSEVFTYGQLSKAGVIVLNEVENRDVVVDILGLSPLKNRGFKYYAVSGAKDGAINTAVISKTPIYSVRVHDFVVGRPILQVEIHLMEKQIFLLAIHGKSKLGDAENAKMLRYELALALNEIAEGLFVENPGCAVVIAGDFNEGSEDLNMMADVRLSSNTFSDCPLKVSGTEDSYTWYSVWLDYNSAFDAQGSYYYNGQWEKIDNILVKNIKTEGCGVIFEKILKNSEGLPSVWNRNLLSGVSDHLPVWVEVVI